MCVSVKQEKYLEHKKYSQPRKQRGFFPLNFGVNTKELFKEIRAGGIIGKEDSKLSGCHFAIKMWGWLPQFPQLI